MGNIVSLEDVTKTYKKGSHSQDALKNISFKVKQGESVVVMGPSGSGKSTLLQLIGGLDYPTSGRVEVNGHEPKNLSDAKRAQFRKTTIGFVFQQFYLQPFLSALDNVALPLRINKVKADEARARAKELLEKVGLSQKLASRPSELSGGEMQRVAIARALANNPKMLLVDEPTGNLDRDNANTVIKLFGKLAKEGTTVIIVTHDKRVAAPFGRIIKLEDGVIKSAKKRKPSSRKVKSSK